jgi:hypothetical protein
MGLAPPAGFMGLPRMVGMAQTHGAKANWNGQRSMNPMDQITARIQGRRTRHRLLSLLASLLAGLAAAACGSGDGDEPQSSTPHVFGSLRAMHYPSAIGGYAADHTYLIAQTDDGHNTVHGCFSNLPHDGEELSGTFTRMDVDLTTVEFMADQAPCKWPLGYYLRVGICHQCANRGLYYTNKTVSAAEGYNFFVTLFGTYGNDQYEAYSLSNCLAAAPAWQGGPFRERAATSRAAGQSEDRSVSDLEMVLYERYFGDIRPLRRDTADDARLHRLYLDDLFGQIIAQRLEDRISESTVDQLQRVRNASLDEKTELDQWATANNYQADELILAYQALFDGLNEQYKAILSPDDYERLFNMGYDTPLDIMHFLPQ